MSQSIQLGHPSLKTPLTLSCQSVPCDNLQGEAHLVQWQDEDGQAHEQVIHLVAGELGEGVLNLSGHLMPFYYHLTDETLYLWIQGQTYHLERLQAGPKRKSGSGVGAGGVSNGEIKAPMPGTVLEVKVKVGDVVTANQPLVIMESMKMEMTLSAPLDGVVETLQATPQTMVEMGTLLVKLKLDPQPSKEGAS
jgi:acetyl/propionyl-CoA carboxylase alpha subunit